MAHDATAKDWAWLLSRQLDFASGHPKPDEPAWWQDTSTRDAMCEGNAYGGQHDEPTMTVEHYDRLVDAGVIDKVELIDGIVRMGHHRLAFAPSQVAAAARLGIHVPSSRTR